MAQQQPEQYPYQATERERQPSSPLLTLDSPSMVQQQSQVPHQLYRSSSADNFYPSPPQPVATSHPLSPRLGSLPLLAQDADTSYSPAYAAPRPPPRQREREPSYRTLYDAPPSPSLGHAPNNGEHGSSTSPFLVAQSQHQHQSVAAGIALPGSPFSANFPADAYDPRPGSSLSATGAAASGYPDPAFRGSYYTDAGGSSSDASSTRRLMYSSGTPSPRYDAAAAGSLGMGGAAAGYFNASNVPHQQQQAGYAGSTLRNGSAANESSIWGDEDADEKGYYGALNKGMGSEETKRAASISRQKRAAYGLGGGKGGRGAGWSARKKVVVFGGLALRA